MGIVQTPKYALRAPDDTELVRNGASALRDLASDVEAALTGALPFRMAAGRAPSGGSNPVTVTYPVGRFTQVPATVVIAEQSTGDGLPIIRANSTTGFTASFYWPGGTPTVSGLNYLAVQMTSTGATG